MLQVPNPYCLEHYFFERGSMKQIRTRYLWVEYGVLENDEITSSDLLVYMGLARFVDNETQRCFPSISSLEKLCRLNRSTIIKSIKHLEALGMIKVTRVPHQVSHYHLLRVGGGKFQLVENEDWGGGNEGQQLVEIRNSNNTYLTIPIYQESDEYKLLFKYLRNDIKSVKNPEAYLNMLVDKYGWPKVKRLAKKNVGFRDWKDELS